MNWQPDWSQYGELFVPSKSNVKLPFQIKSTLPQPSETV